MKADYNSISEHWLTARKILPAKDRELFELFLGNLPISSKIMDLGCGHGIPVAQLIATHGHQIVGVDRSEKLLSHALNAMPEHKWILSELEDFEPSDKYDGIVIWDSLFHLPRAAQLTLLRKAVGVLNPNRMLILSSGGSENDIPPFTDQMFGHTFFYDSFTINQLLLHCSELGLNIIKSTLINTPDGERDKGRLGVVLKKSTK